MSTTTHGISRSLPRSAASSCRGGISTRTTGVSTGRTTSYDSLQYAQDLQGKLSQLGRAAAPWLLVAQIPIVREAPSFVVLQRPDSYGYETEYLGWVVNRDALLHAAVAAGLVLEREFLAPGVIDAPGAPEWGHLHSFLFRRQ